MIDDWIAHRMAELEAEVPLWATWKRQALHEALAKNWVESPPMEGPTMTDDLDKLRASLHNPVAAGYVAGTRVWALALDVIATADALRRQFEPGMACWSVFDRARARLVAALQAE